MTKSQRESKAKWKSRYANRHRVLAACAVALATAVGSSAMGAVAEVRAAETARAETSIPAGTIASLERYCSASWRNAGIRRDQWDDCTQQAMLELIETVSLERIPIAIHDSQSVERRELNRTVWRLVQRCRRAPRLDQFDERRGGATGVHGAAPACKSSGPSATSSERPGWEEVLLAAEGSLTERQIKILELSRDGWRVQEISRLLAMSAERVSDEKYKAIVKLREQLLG